VQRFSKYQEDMIFVEIKSLRNGIHSNKRRYFITSHMEMRRSILKLCKKSCVQKKYKNISTNTTYISKSDKTNTNRSQHHYHRLLRLHLRSSLREPHQSFPRHLGWHFLNAAPEKNLKHSWLKKEKGRSDLLFQQIMLLYQGARYSEILLDKLHEKKKRRKTPLLWFECNNHECY